MLGLSYPPTIKLVFVSGLLGWDMAKKAEQSDRFIVKRENYARGGEQK